MRNRGKCPVGTEPDVLLGHHFPDPLLFPRATKICAVEGLVVHRPTGFAFLRDEDHPSSVARVRRVVASEEVANFVERDLLRVPQASRKDFEF